MFPLNQRGILIIPVLKMYKTPFMWIDENVATQGGKNKYQYTRTSCMASEGDTPFFHRNIKGKLIFIYQDLCFVTRKISMEIKQGFFLNI